MGWDGLVKFLPQPQLLQRGRPHNTHDGLVKVYPERQLSQRGRPHNPDDGLVEAILEP